jgi:hypothetical protein
VFSREGGLQLRLHSEGRVFAQVKRIIDVTDWAFGLFRLKLFHLFNGRPLRLQLSVYIFRTASGFGFQ